MLITVAIILGGVFVIYKICTWIVGSGDGEYTMSRVEEAKVKGEKGEHVVHQLLEQLPEGYKILDNVMLRTRSGTTQIDHIVVSKYGVFAIETKNYRGTIYGTDNSEQWTQIIETPVQYKRFGKVYTYIKKSKFYNPVKQAEGHARALKRLLSTYPHLPIIPIVTFSGEADIDDIESEMKVVYFRDLVEEIQKYQSVFLRDENIDRVAELILTQNVSGQVSKIEHIANIYRSKDEYRTKILNNICPWCGGELVQREGQYGVFYGCKNYPKCKFKTK